ncbi:hypothetical protein P1P68_26290 [Streptomyces scabiei]|uniref:hypothetical protein n=1 Tax=Streptomyces scabiei TaxID=1930 RepID=UPI00298F875F|nr:hypothetical protein [Streptomyces scabiei]MDW8808200.1 hypothetical protein [Streptomyces scabiei]
MSHLRTALPHPGPFRPRRRALLAVAAASLTALLGVALTSGALAEDEEVLRQPTVYGVSHAQ